MKIISITSVKASDIPAQRRNTKSFQMAQEILAKVRANGPQAIKCADLKSWNRYSLQKAIQKAGGKNVVVTQRESTLYVQFVTP